MASADEPKVLDATRRKIEAFFAQRFAKRVDRASQIIFARRTNNEIRAHSAFAEELLAADLAILMGFLDLAQHIGHFAFSCPASHCFSQKRCATFQRAG